MGNFIIHAIKGITWQNTFLVKKCQRNHCVNASCHISPQAETMTQIVEFVRNVIRNLFCCVEVRKPLPRKN
jgi:hypothetical protein